MKMKKRMVPPKTQDCPALPYSLIWEHLPCNLFIIPNLSLLQQSLWGAQLYILGLIFIVSKANSKFPYFIILHFFFIKTNMLQSSGSNSEVIKSEKLNVSSLWGHNSLMTDTAPTMHVDTICTTYIYFNSLYIIWTVFQKITINRNKQN